MRSDLSTRDVDLRPRMLSLCSGIGGLDLGLRHAIGARTVCYVERETQACAVLRARMDAGDLDDAPIWSDLGTFNARAWRDAVDLVCGGFPCQPVSVAGKRRGTDDERWLWPVVRDVLKACGASVAVFENVPGIVAAGLGDILRDLSAIGFSAEWGCFRASEVGAPHRRDRWFCLAYSDRGALRLLTERSQRSQRREASSVGEHSEPVDDRARLEGSADFDGARGAEARGDVDEGASVADTEHARRERSGEAHHDDGCHAPGDDAHGCGTSAFPPPPAGAWDRYRGPKPGVRRDSHGVQGRVDRLRLLGNAVVPQQAAHAWRELVARALKE